MIQLKLTDMVVATQCGKNISGKVVEITNNGCFLDCEGLNFAHRDKIISINGKLIIN